MTHTCWNMLYLPYKMVAVLAKKVNNTVMEWYIAEQRFGNHIPAATNSNKEVVAR
jgi:lauroyl/myristoyl acyltransferase